jgi:hypothetical protein
MNMKLTFKHSLIIIALCLDIFVIIASFLGSAWGDNSANVPGAIAIIGIISYFIFVLPSINNSKKGFVYYLALFLIFIPALWVVIFGMVLSGVKNYQSKPEGKSLPDLIEANFF